MNAHTPTPWKTVPPIVPSRGFPWEIGTASKSYGSQVGIGTLILATGVVNEADAAHIVRCVNAHDELVEACRLQLAVIDGTNTTSASDATRAMRAALAKAEA